MYASFKPKKTRETRVLKHYLFTTLNDSSFLSTFCVCMNADTFYTHNHLRAFSNLVLIFSFLFCLVDTLRSHVILTITDIISDLPNDALYLLRNIFCSVLSFNTHACLNSLG